MAGTVPEMTDAINSASAIYESFNALKLVCKCLHGGPNWYIHATG